MHEGVSLLSNLLRILSSCLGVVTSVRSSQQAAAYTEMSKRCLVSACAHLAVL